jgi:tRNA A-37 threonylcarbamoyl transferase component Bud32
LESPPLRLYASEVRVVEPVRSPMAPSVTPGPWRPTPEARELRLLLRPSPLTSSAEREFRIAAHRPRRIEVGEPAATSQRRAALKSAALFEAAGDFAAARFAYRRAIGLGAEDVATWRALSRTALRDGDGPSAEAAQLAALERMLETAIDPIAFVELRAQIHRDLAKIYLLDGRDRDATFALQASQGISGADPAVIAWLERTAFPLHLEPPPRPHASRPVWPRTPQMGWLEEAEQVVRAARGALPPVVRDEIDSGVAWIQKGSRGRVVAVIGLTGLVLLLLWPVIRQRGDLIVTIEYPEELRGVFRVRLASSRNRNRKPSSDLRSEILKGGISTHSEHHLVNRETHFHRLLARRYFVTVEGVLMDPGTKEILGDFEERKMVRVRHRRSVRLEYDAHPEKCPVDVVVNWGEKPAEDVLVVSRGSEDPVRRFAAHKVRLFLSKGRHSLVVGCGDRVMEHDIEVTSFQPSQVAFDLAGADVVFKGCPPAVEPYLRGDIEAVARALERDGQAHAAYLMLANYNRERGETTRAADYFETAGRYRDAAELRAGIGDHVRAAKLFSQGELPLEAARMYRSAGDLVMAGQAYEEAEDFDAAIQCYREANAIEMWINALERRGRTFEAAKLALDNEQRPRAIRLLQCIMPAEGDYAEASWLLAEAFEREGHFDLAAQKLEQHIATFTPGAAPSDKYARLAQQYEDSGSFERAMEVLQELRRREPTYPNVASRIEHLRKQRSAAERLERTTGSMTSGDAPTAFVSEYRYEILEEIGRGGMGVVFKARDRRLDRVVALKRLPEDLRRRHPKALQLFLREAQSAARLNHRNIVTVYDTDQEDGVFFITMELLDGQNFQQILKERGRLTAGEVVSVGLQVAAGLQYAHGRGIVHRDIKTANLFLTHDEIVKVMDFGLAKMFEEVRGATTIVSGTPFYMSPEQIVGGNVDQRTDLYSLGVTLFELATGRVPFEKGEVAYHHRHTSPPDPRDLQPDIPEELARILLDLLEKDIANRLHSADELIGRLEEIEGRIADRD